LIDPVFPLLPSKGSVVEVDVSEMGLVTQTGKVVVSKYAQVTNDPENDGTLNYPACIPVKH